MLDTATPELTDLVFEASAAGHVVRHGGRTVLYDDGTGSTTILDTGALLGAEAASGELPAGETHEAEAAH